MPYKLSGVLDQLAALMRELGRNLRDLLPILCVVALFQWLVIGQPMPQLELRPGGVLLALLGLTLFVRDIARDIIGGGRPASRTNVYEIMEKPAPFLDADMDIRYAIRHMSRCGFTHCIVVHGRELAGIVTLRELTIRHIAAGTA